MARRDRQTCVCGHGFEPHEHYRGGTDCSWCPTGGCARFRPAGGLPRLLLRLVADPVPGGRGRRRSR